ncbi:MAG TPA: ABC transporter permease [Patescibacteria group bacterium]|nr:ABC transporter permease [Patescibacteria group bacterium]
MSKNFRKPRQLPGYFALSWYAFKAQTRNPATFAFGFIFPIVFISIFGLIGNTPQKLTIGVPKTSSQNNPVIAALQKQSYVILKRSNESTLETQLKQGKLSGILAITEMPANHFSVSLITSSANQQEAATLQGTMQGITDALNLHLAGVTHPPVTLTQQEVSGRQNRYIDFALPGQIGFSLLSTAVFGTVFGLIYLKKALVLKRMFSTPSRPLTILFAQGTSRLIMAIMQTLLILLFGVFLFHFYLPHGLITFAELMLIAALGLIAFLGFGYFMAGLVNDENSASPLVNLVTLPQFLLSGTFFSTDSLPNWVQPIANNLPLSYFNVAVRKITTEGGNFVDTVPYLIGLLLWGIVMYVLAAWTFKWE